MKTTELKKLMPPHVVDVQGHGINEFYTPEQVVEILRLLGVVGQSEQLRAFKQFLQSEYHLPVSNRMVYEFEQKQSS